MTIDNRRGCRYAVISVDFRKARQIARFAQFEQFGSCPFGWE